MAEPVPTVLAVPEAAVAEVKPKPCRMYRSLLVIIQFQSVQVEVVEAILLTGALEAQPLLSVIVPLAVVGVCMVPVLVGPILEAKVALAALVVEEEIATALAVTAAQTAATAAAETAVPEPGKGLRLENSVFPLQLNMLAAVDADGMALAEKAAPASSSSEMRGGVIILLPMMQMVELILRRAIRRGLKV